MNTKVAGEEGLGSRDTAGLKFMVFLQLALHGGEVLVQKHINMRWEQKSRAEILKDKG